MKKKLRVSRTHRISDSAASRENTQKSSKNSLSNIGKGKIVFLLILFTAIITGIYIAAVKLRFEPIFHLYWIISAVLACAAAVLQKRNEYLYTKDMASGVSQAQSEASRGQRLKRIKYLLIILIPFLFTVFADAVYLLFLADLDIFKAVADVFG